MTIGQYYFLSRLNIHLHHSHTDMGNRNHADVLCNIYDMSAISSVSFGLVYWLIYYDQMVAKISYAFFQKITRKIVTLHAN